MAKALSPSLILALSQLRSALSALEGAAAVRDESDRDARMAQAELSAMQEDRTRLALELDAALSKAGRLEAITGDLARRIDRAIGSVRGALDATRAME